MTKITNHTELEVEKKRLELLLESKKSELLGDFEKINFDPADKIVNVVTKITRPNPNKNVLNAGLNAGINLIMKNTILGRAGFITRLILPAIVKKIVKNKIKQKKNHLTERNQLHTSVN